MEFNHPCPKSLPDTSPCSSRPIRYLFTLCAFLASCNEQVDDLVRESDIGKWKYYTRSHGLASDYINTIFEDSKGNVWIGTDQGISVYRAGDFDHYSGADGLISNSVFAITEDHNGNIWVGTPNGLNIFFENNWYYFNYFYGVGVFALEALDGEEGVLIGTSGYGVYRYDFTDETFEPYNIIENCEACNSINTIFQSKDKSVWIATFMGARKIKDNSVTTIDSQDGLPGDIATSIAEDGWGNIWIGTVEGTTITKVSGSIVSQVSFNNGADQNFIFGIQEDNEGHLWVGTVGNGLFHYDGAIMKQIYEGPPDNTITAMIKDSHGNLWIGTSGEGLAQYITNPLH